jgi:hypothetical protein
LRRTIVAIEEREKIESFTGRSIMANKNAVTVASSSRDDIKVALPFSVWKNVNKPPIIPGERAEDYEDFFSQISAAVQPKDMIEWLLTEDIVALAWEVNRLRRLKVGILDFAHEGALGDVLAQHQVVPRERARGTALDYRVGIDRRRVHAKLKHDGFSMDMVMGKALEKKIDIVERVDRLLMAAGARRDAVLREIERRRDSLASRMRRAIDVVDVVDVPTS